MTTRSQKRGDTAEWDVDDIVDGDGAPVTVGQVRMTVRSSLDVAVAPVIDVTAPISNGSAHIKVPPAATSALSNLQTRWLSHDIQVEVGTDRWTIDAGVYIIEPAMATA